MLLAHTRLGIVNEPEPKAIVAPNLLQIIVLLKKCKGHAVALLPLV